MKRVRITQIDGKLPNLALMKLAHYHRMRGDEVVFTREIRRDLTEAPYDLVYGSAIFSFSAARVERFRWHWPQAIVGGTGSGSDIAVEDVLAGLNQPEYEHYDYSIYPDFKPSIGFTQRGCRLKCKFCVVPTKEGKNRGVNTIEDIWRGGAHDKKLMLLDNDFFGQPEWRERIAEIRAGGFRVCLNQGINVRLIDDEAAEALASIEYRDTKFQERRVYTAWDNLKDERVFFRGIDRLTVAGIRADHIMAYMLIGYDPAETWERIFRRFNRMVERGVLPYPMVYDPARKDLKAFQKWVVMGLYRTVSWADFDDPRKGWRPAA